MGSQNEIKIEAETSTEALNNNKSISMNNGVNSSLKVMPVNECKEDPQKIIVVQDSTAVIIMGLVFLVVLIGLFYFLPKWSPSEDCRGSSNAAAAEGNFSSQKRSTDSLISANQVPEDEDYYCTSSQTTKLHSPNSITFAPSTY